MSTLKDILNKKGNNIFSVSSKNSVFEALQKMASENIGALLVIDNDSLVGIISERDYARKVILKGKSSKETKVKEIMTDNVVFLDASQTPEESLAVMTNKRIRHLPVYDNGKLAGIISIGDVVKAIIDHKEYLIDHLQEYITARR